jgi:hypothetical protein
LGKEPFVFWFIDQINITSVVLVKAPKLVQEWAQTAVSSIGTTPNRNQKSDSVVVALAAAIRRRFDYNCSQL